MGSPIAVGFGEDGPLTGWLAASAAVGGSESVDVARAVRIAGSGDLAESSRKASHPASMVAMGEAQAAAQGVGTDAWCGKIVREFTTTARENVGRIADLALALAQSGEVLPPAQWRADVASTGGPGSLTTLLCPLHLVQKGYDVAKVGVPGRPAGAIDSLGTLAGYVASLDSNEVTRVIDLARFASTLPTHFAPADGALFSYRKRHGAQAVPSLVIASLLSKKLAVGLTSFVIEVRQMDGGNFGATREEAQANAEMLVSVATELGLRAAAPVSRYDEPPQPYIGRLEALVALLAAVGDGSNEPWLDEHFRYCRGLADLLPTSPTASEASLNETLDRHLFAQGAVGIESMASEVERRSRKASRCELAASRAGRLSWRPATIRAALVSAQRADVSHQFSDPLGIVLRVRSGAEVAKGEPVAEVRASTARGLAAALRELAASMDVE